MDLQEVGHGDMDWIELAQDRDRRRARRNAVISLQVTKKKEGISRLAENRLDSQEELWSME
jgi:hypothetical protein